MSLNYPKYLSYLSSASTVILCPNPKIRYIPGVIYEAYKHNTVIGLSPNERLYEFTRPNIIRNVSTEVGRSFPVGQKLNVNIFNSLDSLTPCKIKSNSQPLWL